MTILAFGAHPDDIEFGCGAVIARAGQEGARVHCVVGSRGESATHGTAEQRESEARAGANVLNAALEFCDLGGDAHMAWSPLHVLRVAEIIRRVRPNVVLAPTLVENQHPDHPVVGRIVRDAARAARYGGVAELRELPPHTIDQLLHYAVTVEGEPTDSAAIWIDVSDAAVIAQWTRAMEAHASQAKSRDYVSLQLTRSRLNGMRAGVVHAWSLFPSDPLVFSSLNQLGRGARRF